MRLLFTFMQNPWQCLVWWVDRGFNGGKVYRRRPLQQGYIRGYGSQWPQEGFEDIKAYRREKLELYPLNVYIVGLID